MRENAGIRPSYHVQLDKHARQIHQQKRSGSLQQNHLLRPGETGSLKPVKVNAGCHRSAVLITSVPRHGMPRPRQCFVRQRPDEGSRHVVYTEHSAPGSRQLKSNQRCWIERIGRVLEQAILRRKRYLLFLRDVRSRAALIECTDAL